MRVTHREMASLHGGARPCGGRRWHRPVIALLLAVMSFACPAAHAAETGFALATPRVLVRVIIREPLPDMSMPESTALLRRAMLHAIPGTVAADLPNGTAAQLRFVWHVIPVYPDGATSRLVLNVFAGGRPFWYEQSIVGSDEARKALVGTAAAMMRRFAAGSLRPLSLPPCHSKKSSDEATSVENTLPIARTPPTTGIAASLRFSQ